MNTIQPFAELNFELTPERQQKMASNLATLEDLAARYEQDPALRARIDSGDVDDSLAGLAIELPAGVEAKIAANTKDTFHVVFPPDPNTELSEEMLNALGGGKTAGSAGSVSTAGSASCPASTYSSVGCAGTVGSAS